MCWDVSFICFCSQTDLSHWIVILNNFDAVMHDFIAEYGAYFQISEKLQSFPGSDVPDGFQEKMICIEKILHFSALLLKNSYHKDVYNSVEVTN